MGEGRAVMPWDEHQPIEKMTTNFWIQAGLSRKYGHPLIRAGCIATLVALATPFGWVGATDFNPAVIGSAELNTLSEDVAVRGNYAYVAAGTDGLQIFDISDTQKPHKVSEYDSDGFASAVDLSGGYAYLADGRTYERDRGIVGGSLTIIDIRDPHNPILAGQFHTSGSPADVIVRDGYAYLADGTGDDESWVGAGLIVLDVGTVSEIRFVASSETIGSARALEIDGDWLYLADANTLRHQGCGSYGVDKPGEGLIVFGISDPNDLQRLGAVKIRNGFPPIDYGYIRGPRCHGGGRAAIGATDVVVVDQLAYVVSQYQGIQVIDCQDPQNMAEIGSYDGRHGQSFDFGGSDPHQASLWGQVLCLTDGGSGIELLDIQDPTKLGPIGSTQDLSYADGIAIADGIAWVTGYGRRRVQLSAVDLQRPANPQSTGHLLTINQSVGITYSDIDFSDLGFALLTGWDEESRKKFHLLDLSDPSNPRLDGNVDLGARADDDWRIATIDGGLAYILNQSGLTIIDLADPSQPQTLGAIPIENYTYLCKVSGGTAFVVGRGGDTDEQLLAVDVSDPSDLQQIGEFALDPGNYPRAIELAGDELFLMGHNKLQIFNVGDPRQPELLGEIAVDGVDLKIVGNTAVVVESRGGLSTIDLIDLSKPVRTASHAIPGSAYSYGSDLAISGNLAYVSSTTGLHLFDISEPTDPLLVGGNSIPTEGKVEIVGDHVFVMGSSYLSAFELLIPSQRPPIPLQLSLEAPGATERLPMGLVFSGPRGLSVVVQRSKDLRHWEDWSSPFVFAGHHLRIAELGGPELTRYYYRAMPR